MRRSKARGRGGGRGRAGGRGGRGGGGPLEGFGPPGFQQQQGGFRQQGGLQQSWFRQQGGFQQGGFRSDGDFLPFSMNDEARNTERHYARWSTQLRNTTISFVSAGTLDPGELLKPLNVDPAAQVEKVSSAGGDGKPAAATNLPIAVVGDSLLPLAEPKPNGDGTTDQINVISSLDPSGDGSEARPEVAKDAPIQQEDDKAMPGFTIDLTGDEDLAPSQVFKAPTIRAPSPNPSVSSSASEKIVFVPKGNRGIPQEKQALPKKRVSAPTVSTRIRPTPFPPVIKTTTATSITLPQLSKMEAEPTPAKAPMQPEGAFIQLKPQEWSGKRATAGNKRRKPKTHGRHKAQEAAIEDYIENVASQMRAEARESSGEPSASFLRELPGGDEWMDPSATDSDDEASDSDAVRRYKSLQVWDSEQLQEFDDLSTDSEEPNGPIFALLGKRTRPSGLQYLIKWYGYDARDATWVLAGKLGSSADSHIKKYEDHLAEKVAQMSASSGSESSDELDEEDEEDDDDDDGEADEDEDRKLARLLQKQEELQMLGVEDDFDEIMTLDSDFFPMGVGKGSKQQRKKQRKSKQAVPFIAPDSSGQFPSATKMAAAYEAFDVMDWNRPSLLVKKGKAKLADLKLSDPELEAQLQSSWQCDREAKKLRKIQRQELREQGMLGAKARNTGQPKLTDKYKEGMTLGQVYEEIRSFLLCGNSTLSLPPMTKHDRKIVHELAAKLNLKSKSVGGGMSRFTIITKTSQSARYECDEEGVDAMMRSGRFMKRADASGSGQFKKGGGGGGAGGSGKAMREGMVVGAEAPELSATNRGRLILEKMGYVTGMSLGVEGKGISEPVVAIIKMSKAGLG